MADTKTIASGVVMACVACGTEAAVSVFGPVPFCQEASVHIEDRNSGRCSRCYKVFAGPMRRTDEPCNVPCSGKLMPKIRFAEVG